MVFSFVLRRSQCVVIALCNGVGSRVEGCIPIVSIVVPFFGLTKSILRILKGNPKKELQWRL